MRNSVKLVITASFAFAFVGAADAAHADTVGPTTFESPTYSSGSVGGQNGWSSAGVYDQAVAPTNRFPSFGAQSLRISSAVTADALGGQTFSGRLASPAGESAQRHFDAMFQIGTTRDSRQSGLHLSVSPADGNGARMSFLRFEDQGDGVHVFFDDVTDPSFGALAKFNEKDIATLDRSNAHTVRFSIDFIAGPANDVAKIYVDGALKTTGMSWEDYYRYDPDASGTGNQLPTVDRMLFRESHDAAPDTAGQGFLVDNLTLASSTFSTTPTGVAASAGNTAALVHWNAPSSDGGSPVTGYTVTAFPDGQTVTTTGASMATITGLTQGTPCTFTVTATNGVGISGVSGPSLAVTPVAPAPGPAASVTRLSDFNRNGFSDRVTRDAVGTLWLYPSGAGRYNTRRPMGSGWNTMTAILSPGDVTHDGDADVIARDSLGRLWLYPGNGISGVGARRQIGSGWQTFTITNASDLNRDGRPDLLARDSAGVLWQYPLRGKAVFGPRFKMGNGWNENTLMGPGDNADIFGQPRQIGHGWNGMRTSV